MFMVTSQFLPVKKNRPVRRQACLQSYFSAFFLTPPGSAANVCPAHFFIIPSFFQFVNTFRQLFLFLWKRKFTFVVIYLSSCFCPPVAHIFPRSAPLLNTFCKFAPLTLSFHILVKLLCNFLCTFCTNTIDRFTFSLYIIDTNNKGVVPVKI